MCNILVVEDDTDGRATLTEILECAGYQVHCAENGQAALSHINECKPKVVITDLAMPVMDGLSMLRELRDQETEFNDEGPKVIAISAQHQCNLDSAKMLGADQTYHKPISCFRLLRDVRKLMTNQPLNKVYVAR